jgi:hypothetical protein
MTNDEQLTTLYEVYERRSELEGIDGLPLLDRTTNMHAAERTAREWGGVVFRLECRIITWRPMQREVVRMKIVYRSPQRGTFPDPTAGLTLRDLRGKLGKHGGARTRYDAGTKKNRGGGRYPRHK